MAPNYPTEVYSLDFQAEVEAELDFLKKFPIMDQTERIKAENLRKIERAERRKELRKYKGPPIVSDEAMEAENKRLHDLRKQFNKESARWSKVYLKLKTQNKGIFMIKSNEVKLKIL